MLGCEWRESVVNEVNGIKVSGMRYGGSGIKVCGESVSV